MTQPSVRLQTTVGGALTDAFAALRVELGLAEAFPPEVDAEAAQAVAAAELPEANLLEFPFITIDPEGSTDLDQAMYLLRDGDGYRVYYAIADVPAYVKPGGAIDTEARLRGQTMYAPDGRIPLHPTAISEGAASLLPNQECGAFVWDFRLDATASVTGVSLGRARIRSTRQANYDEVQREIDGGTASETLVLLKEVGLGRIELERQRGGASLNRPSEEIAEDDGHYVLERRRALPVEDWNAQLSLMTGMAAAELMVKAGVGILRTMPAPDADTIATYRRQAAALGCPWPEGVAYGEFLRSLDSSAPNQLAAIYAASKLFRGAGYTVLDGTVERADAPIQAALGAPYTHVTAPLRRLVDRFALLVCEALVADSPLPDWLATALPTLPAIMASSSAVASRLDNGAIAAVEAAVLSTRVGETFAATVISAGEGRGVIQLTDPAVTANCDGTLTPGETVRATLVEADIVAGTVLFRLAAS